MLEYMIFSQKQKRSTRMPFPPEIEITLASSFETHIMSL